MTPNDGPLPIYALNYHRNGLVLTAPARQLRGVLTPTSPELWHDVADWPEVFVDPDLPAEYCRTFLAAEVPPPFPS